jgi:hypothetical protein
MVSPEVTRTKGFPRSRQKERVRALVELFTSLDDTAQVVKTLSFARTLHVYQDKRIAPITVRLIPRLLSGELKKKAGQTATNTTPRVTAIVCANRGKSEAAKRVATPNHAVRS